jgi:hypothetical protein
MGHLDDLAELRENLRTWLQDAPEGSRAALAAQYRATLSEIEDLRPKQEVARDGIDEITARRAARRSSPAKGSGRSKRSG